MSVKNVLIEILILFLRPVAFVLNKIKPRPSRIGIITAPRLTYEERLQYKTKAYANNRTNSEVSGCNQIDSSNSAGVPS